MKRSCGEYYVNQRWLGGMLTNYKTISNSIKKLNHIREASPSTDAEYIRCIFESFAHCYVEVTEKFSEMAPFPIEKLHIIGGGSQNDLMNRLTARTLGIPVVAGPSEATAIGNCMMQAKAAGLVSDRWEMRRIIAQAFAVKTYHPEGTTR